MSLLQLTLENSLVSLVSLTLLNICFLFSVVYSLKSLLIQIWCSYNFSSLYLFSTFSSFLQLKSFVNMAFFPSSFVSILRTLSIIISSVYNPNFSCSKNLFFLKFSSHTSNTYPTFFDAHKLQVISSVLPYQSYNLLLDFIFLLH